MKLFNRKKKVDKELASLLEGYELPSFPEAVMKVLTKLRESEAPISDISHELELDPGMNVKVLKTVNSAAFGLSSKVTNVHHAVTLLGRTHLEALVVSIAVKDVVPEVEDARFDSHGFWLCSVRRASLARALARQIHPETESEAFTAGLLQDMAVPVLANVKKDKYINVYSGWKTGEYSKLDELEREAFGLDHASVGSMLAEEWELPEYLSNAITNHHKSDEDIAVDPAIKLVACLRDGCEEQDIELLVESCKSDYNLEADTIAKLVKDSFNEAQSFMQMLK